MSMDGLQQGRDRDTRTPKERLFRNRNPDIRPTKIGTVVRALWPVKPALNLAQRLGCTERAARYYINGERKVSARCIAVIINECLD